MTALESYRDRREVAVGEASSAIPDAARGIVEWAQSAEAAYSLAQRLVSTSFSPQQYRNKPEDAAAAILSGAEVGLSPMASLRAFDVIQGTAAPRALTIRAIVQGQGHEMVVDEATPQRVRMRGRRRGSAEWQQVEWTIQRATQLGLAGKQQWKSQPQTMLIARCTSELGRLIAADALLGLPYSIEELADAEPEPTTPVSRVPSGEAKPARVSRAKRQPAPEPPEPDLDEPVHLPETAPAAAPEPGPSPFRGGLSEAQMRKLQAAYRDRGLSGDDNRTARLDDASSRLSEEVVSFSDLTPAQAHKLIDSLEQPDVEEPPLDGDDPWQG